MDATRCLVLTLLIGTALLAACNGPVAVYEPIPVIASSPLVLHDEAEVRTYLNAFPVDQYRRYEIRGVGYFYVDDGSDLIKRFVVEGRQWEKHIVKLLREHVKTGMVVLDLGAHIGTHTILMSKLVGPWGRVYAFEPQKKIYRELYHNIHLNGANNVKALRYAIGQGPAQLVEMNPATAGNEAE